MNATTMMQVVANILDYPIEHLDLTGSQAYRNGYAGEMDVDHDVDVMVRDQYGLINITLQNLEARYPNLEIRWVNKGYDGHLPYMGVCGYMVNIIGLSPDEFRAWQHATALTKAEWANGLEAWMKDARVAFFKAARDSYLAGLVAGRQGR